MSNYPPPPSGQPYPPDPSLIPPGMYRASDGNVYPQQQYHPQPPPQKKGGAGKVLLIVLGAIVALCGVGGVIAAVAGNSTDDTVEQTGSTVTTVAGAPGTTVAGAPATTARAAAPTAKTPTTKVGFGDVQITACAMSDNQFLGPEARVRVTNNSSKPSNYMVQVAFVSKDGATQYDTGTVLVNSLAPAQSTEDTAASIKTGVREQAAAGFNCKVLDVTRFAS